MLGKKRLKEEVARRKLSVEVLKNASLKCPIVRYRDDRRVTEAEEVKKWALSGRVTLDSQLSAR